MKTRQRLIRSMVWMLAVAVFAMPSVGAAQLVPGTNQIDIHGPAGSGAFGTQVVALPNGRVVVTDPYYDAGATADVGAVYLYDGATGAQISVLTGSTAGDQVGYPGITTLDNGNYVVMSQYWDNGAATDAGAVTWGSGTSGVNDVVSANNSLVGSTAHDMVGWVTALSSGNYVVSSAWWDNGPAVDAGAVTWGSGTAGVKGAVSAANSLMGSTAGDEVGRWGVVELTNGNYVVGSPSWNNGPAVDAGAVTWGSGTAGVKGLVSPANSLVGSSTDDRVGGQFGTVRALSNGNYVVGSPYWDNNPAVDVGAATWGNGTTGISGVLSAANSLVGSSSGDQVGWVTALSNGNYVVQSPNWDDGATAADVGAVTWGNGMSGASGPVSKANSLVGSTAGDQVGYDVTALSNGNYVVASFYWDNAALGAADAGAATWGNGATGTAGAVSSGNSLVGSTADDLIGRVTALTNGNYVVSSAWWDSHTANGTVVNAGAATWGNGTAGTAGFVSGDNSLIGSRVDDLVAAYGAVALGNGNYVVGNGWWDNGTIVDAGASSWGNGTGGTAGVVSAANSLVGSTAGDGVGRYLHLVTALSNGNYLVRTPYWDNGGVVDAGAVTWASGTTGVTGAVSAANSLVGSSAGDKVGCANEYDYCRYGGVASLSNGQYVVASPWWDGGALADTGAATWGNGTTGTLGPVSQANSLVGSTTGDRVGYDVTAVGDGSYVVWSPYWDNGFVKQSGPAADAGAVTWGSRTGATVGPITNQNSVLGTAASGGEQMRWTHDEVNHQLVVGRPGDNIVTLFRPFYPVFLPLVLRDSPG